MMGIGFHCFNYDFVVLFHDLFDSGAPKGGNCGPGEPQNDPENTPKPSPDLSVTSRSSFGRYQGFLKYEEKKYL